MGKYTCIEIDSNVIKRLPLCLVYRNRKRQRYRKLVSAKCYRMFICCSSSPPSLKVSLWLRLTVVLPPKDYETGVLTTLKNLKTDSITSNMGEFNIELIEKHKLNDNNFVNWKVCMKSILRIKRLYNLVEGTETATFSLEQDKIDPTRKELAFEIICINCDVKIASQFSAEANDDPAKLWKSIDSFYQPKTIQNQTSYLNRIFSSHLPKARLEEVLNRILEQTLMWVIINLPAKYKTEGEMWLKKCEIKKKTPSLRETIEELCFYIQQNEENAENAKAFAAPFRDNRSPNLQCNETFHNPMAKHSEEDFWKLHPEKLPKGGEKPIKALRGNTKFVLDSGAMTTMVNSLDYFIQIQMKTEEI
ncbi:hypothetical protein O181_019444 [Austropuccinia psidii MF-1]|uniref:DUF4219 domain-containing protein n=1 Tax=Austropuccinia psidii MF-1 TaxID=1389203 RepID=A0A9Q3C737_9BASI|nr:hypothetical protein [Austropuccinia psidii MF-1]